MPPASSAMTQGAPDNGATSVAYPRPITTAPDRDILIESCAGRRRHGTTPEHAIAARVRDAGRALLERVLLVSTGGLQRLLFGLRFSGGLFPLGAQLREALSIGLARALRAVLYADQFDLEDECGLYANQKVSRVHARARRIDGVEAMIYAQSVALGGISSESPASP